MLYGVATYCTVQDRSALTTAAEGIRHWRPPQLNRVTVRPPQKPLLAVRCTAAVAASCERACAQVLQLAKQQR
jgi:hypothetical protein